MKTLFLAPLFVVLAHTTAQAQWLSYEFPLQEQEKKSDQEVARKAEDSRRMGEEITREANRTSQETTRRTNESVSDATLRTARGLRLQTHYAASAKLYADFISKNPNSTRLHEARFWLAKCCFSDQKWDEAADAFTEFLKHHSDQRSYSRQAKEDRIYCWRVRRKENPKAIPGLKAALGDADEEIRILAALALAEGRDASSRLVLVEQGLNNARFREQSALALWRLGVRGQPKPPEGSAPRVRMLVIRVKTDNPGESFEMRFPVNFIRNMEKMLPDEAKEEMTRKGIELSGLAEMAVSATKGQVLFQFKSDDGKISVVISVD